MPWPADRARQDYHDRDRASGKFRALTPEQVRELIGEHGDDHKTLAREARKLWG
ncbi:MAG: DUF3606 domain-containing protein [Mesorhizobium sp.]|nr:DUF3606 domain-containing protein [Mesorhizobium sp. M1D.F.Ca.ET.043.01.1.1]RWA94619.1 MAG: DUF3606 domain-containing protein [Mesorhizobium sp.]RWD66717.1 MAG: DUF3606 domain-containing protein [Mesorhizobium sp.]RWE03954.1 MAG: DUF3606 domain-containing protein [Mesorhizobium sp.]RWE31049.1 MAG: DUF3606 domain-containing protein [Mesorhizobium sp.]